MRTWCVALIAAFAVAAVAVSGTENGTESGDKEKRVPSIDFKGDKSEIEFGRSVADEDVYYDDVGDEENEVSDRPEARKVVGEGSTSSTASPAEGGVPTEVFLVMRNLSEDGENFRTFKKRNDAADLQASASDNVGVATTGDDESNGTAELGWNSRAYRDARYPPELSIVADEPVQHVLLSHQHSTVDAPDLSDCARQGEWRPIGEIHIDSNHKDLQQEHDYLLPSGSHDSQQSSFGLYGSNFGSGEHSFHSFYGGGPSQGSLAEFQKLTADAASAQSVHGGFDLNNHLQKYVAGSVSSYAPAFGDGGGGFGDTHSGAGGGSLSYSSDFEKIPFNHNFNGIGDQNGGGGQKFYHGQGNILSTSGSGGYGKPKQPNLGSFGSVSSGGGAFLRGKPGGHHVRYAPGGFSFNRKPGPNAFGDGAGLHVHPKGPFIRGKKPGNGWKFQKIKGGGGGGGFRRPNFDSLKGSPYVEGGGLGGSGLSGTYHGGHGGSGSIYSGHGGSGVSGFFSGGHGSSGSSGAFLGGYGSSGSSGALLGGHGSSGSSGAFSGGHGSSSSSGVFLGGHGSSGSSGGLLGGHGNSGSSGAFLGGHGSSGSSGALLGGHGSSSSSGAFLGGHGSSGSSGALLGGHGGSSSSGAFFGDHGSSGSAGTLLGGSISSGGHSAGHGISGSSGDYGASGPSGSVLAGYGDSGSTADLLVDHGGLAASGSGILGHGGSGYSSGSIPVGYVGFGGSGLITGHKGTVEGGSLLDNTLHSGHAENVALASAFTDQSYGGQNVGQITHEAILQDASQLTSFTCGKNHDHGTNYHTASFQVSDDDHGSQDVLQYQDGAHVIIHAASNGFEDAIHAERKQSDEGGGDSSASATKESSLEIITGNVKGASNHRYGDGGNNDENSGTSDQIEEPTSHSYYRDKFPSTENSPVEFDYGSDSEKPQIIKELEELGSRFQLDLDSKDKYAAGKGISYETYFGDQEGEKKNPVIHGGFSVVNVNDFDVGSKDDRFRYEEYQGDGEVITEYPYHLHLDGDVPENLPVVISEHHPHRGDKPKTHIPPKRNHPGKQYEVHENSGEKQIPTTEIFPPQKFPRQFHNPMPNLAGRPPKEGAKYVISSPYGSYPILPPVQFKKFKKYKPIPGKLKYRRPIFVRRPIPITSAPVVRVSVSS